MHFSGQSAIFQGEGKPHRIIYIYIYTMTFSLHQGGVVMSSQITHTHNHQDTPLRLLAHILDTLALIFSSCVRFTVNPNHIM